MSRAYLAPFTLTRPSCMPMKAPLCNRTLPATGPLHRCRVCSLFELTFGLCFYHSKPLWNFAPEFLSPGFLCRPGFIALKLCPELVFVKPNFQRYSEASRAVKDILRQYDADLDSASLDEAHLDITDYCRANNLSGAFRALFHTTNPTSTH